VRPANPSRVSAMPRKYSTVKTLTIKSNLRRWVGRMLVCEYYFEKTMVHVVTISANTAAYAVEPLKASARVSGTSPSEQTTKALAEQARKSGDLRQRVLMNVVQPPSLALFFLTADHHQPQSTLDMARQQYLLNAGEDDPASEGATIPSDPASDDRVDPI